MRAVSVLLGCIDLKAYHYLLISLTWYRFLFSTYPSSIARREKEATSAEPNVEAY